MPQTILARLQHFQWCFLYSASWVLLAILIISCQVGERTRAIRPKNSPPRGDCLVQHQCELIWQFEFDTDMKEDGKWNLLNAEHYDCRLLTSWENSMLVGNLRWHKYYPWFRISYVHVGRAKISKYLNLKDPTVLIGVSSGQKYSNVQIWNMQGWSVVYDLI